MPVTISRVAMRSKAELVGIDLVAKFCNWKESEAMEIGSLSCEN